MPEPAPLDVVRSRFPHAASSDEAELQTYAQYLNSLRGRVLKQDLHRVEVAVTFDPRGVK